MSSRRTISWAGCTYKISSNCVSKLYQLLRRQTTYVLKPKRLKKKLTESWTRFASLFRPLGTAWLRKKKLLGARRQLTIKHASQCSPLRSRPTESDTRLNKLRDRRLLKRSMQDSGMRKMSMLLKSRRNSFKNCRLKEIC